MRDNDASVPRGEYPILVDASRAGWAEVRLLGRLKLMNGTTVLLLPPDLRNRAGYPAKLGKHLSRSSNDHRCWLLRVDLRQQSGRSTQVTLSIACVKEEDGSIKLDPSLNGNSVSMDLGVPQDLVMYPQIQPLFQWLLDTIPR